MKNSIYSAVFGVGVVLAMPSTLLAEQIDHSKMDQSETDKASKKQATGRGVINSIADDKKSMNITHEPMPELGWPEMTMDLPVTKKVDITQAKKGATVDFTIKLGRDKKYRIIKIAPAE